MTASIKKSGRNIRLALVGETYDEMLAGTFDVTGKRSVSKTNQEIFQVTVQCDPDNQGSLFIGNRSGCHIELEPGESITIPINDLKKVYVRGEFEGTVVNWLAMT